MAERPTAPNQSDQASKMTKAEGDRTRERERNDQRELTGEHTNMRDSDRDERADERADERDQPRAAGRDRLDPREVREVLDETSEKHRRGEDIGASGISNRNLAEEQEEQAELPARGARKAGGGA